MNRIRKNHIPFEPFYPDVIGAVTRGPRINMDELEALVGIHPRMAYLNQPIEVVIVLQNMIDQELPLKIAIRVPTQDRSGNVVVIEVAKPQVSLTLSPGEASVLRMPLVVYPPTKAGKDFPVRIAIRYRAPKNQHVRPPGGGSPPSVLSVSPFKLQVLREIEFVAHKWNESTDILTVNFDLVAKSMPGNPEDSMKMRYETLWTQEVMEKEIQLARTYLEDAYELAKPGTTGSLYLAMMDAVEERFANHNMPLHPGETMAIAKMISYTVEDAPAREPNHELENTRWFRGLCQLLASNPALKDLGRDELLSKYLFEGCIYEALLLAFKILKHNVKENLGDAAEQINYANRFMKWLGGHGDADLSYVYLPLVLGGVAVARMVRGAYVENPWDVVDELNEAIRGRLSLASGEETVIFTMLERLIEDYQRKLRSQRIERPDRR